MSDLVEQAVARYLGSEETEWEKLKPVMCFVVLWNRLEGRHGEFLKWGNLSSNVQKVIDSKKRQFDISRYQQHVEFFQSRYSEDPNKLLQLLWNRDPQAVKDNVNDLVAGNLCGDDNLFGMMAIPYRIRNNLFHGRKSPVELHLQKDLFLHVNEILCLFHEDLTSAGHKE